MRAILLVMLYSIFLSGCASQISTSNKLVTTIYNEQSDILVANFQETVSSMDNYTIESSDNNILYVEYDPANIMMGSAKVKVEFREVDGMTKAGERVNGIELVYTDITSFFSQDTTFSGADIIDRINQSFVDLASYKEIEHFTVKKLDNIK